MRDINTFRFLNEVEIEWVEWVIVFCFEERMETMERNGKVENSNQKEFGILYSLKKGKSFDKIKGKEMNSHLHLISSTTKKRAGVC